MLLALRHDGDHRVCRHVIHLTPRRGEARGHDVGAREDETDRTAIHSVLWQNVRVAVEQVEGRDEGAASALKEDELTVGREDELDVVLAFAHVEGLLLRQDHLDVLLKRRVLKGIGEI